jgi:hypothetical protein
MKNVVMVVAILSALVAATTWPSTARAEDTPKIPGAGPGGSSGGHESVIEGTLDKYDSTLNKLTIKGIDEDKMTLDAVPSLKAKDGTKRLPMATVKLGQKIRVFYAEKNKKKIAKDVEIVRDEEEQSSGKKEKEKEKSGKDEPVIPGAR